MNILIFFKNTSLFRIGIIVFTLGSSLLLMGDLSALIQQYYRGKRSIEVTVFVHGSVYTVLSMLDAKRVLNDALQENSPYVNLVKSVRKNPLIWQDQIMVAEGLHPFDQVYIDQFFARTLIPDDRPKAAYQFIPVYDKLFQAHNAHVERKYYLFGHLGLLSQRYRRNAADELYHALCDELAKLQKKYWQVRVTLIAHSHGGNIVLNLADVHEQCKRSLAIDNVVMFGTPIQPETVMHAYHPIFKRIINCYSDGDNVQNNDRFSTKERYSYKRIFDEKATLNCPDVHENKIYDVRLLLNGNKRTIGHTHMWLMGREKKISDTFDPLPIAILTPLLLDLFDKRELTLDADHIDCNIVDTYHVLRLELAHFEKQDVLTTSLDVHNSMVSMCNLVKENWMPIDKSRMLLFNYQTGAALWQAFQEWRHYNHTA
ncbi:MAG TPA: hypothetical protein PLU71_04090 [Candidatus Dependentiae bacterium]|nr:hypothetical protein [Candidatus Dependentiae bacterium]HRQ63013.1 hypothetical protein [Candidatus Dependentiae bacterium]